MIDRPVKRKVFTGKIEDFGFGPIYKDDFPFPTKGGSGNLIRSSQSISSSKPGCSRISSRDVVGLAGRQQPVSQNSSRVESLGKCSDYNKVTVPGPSRNVGAHSSNPQSEIGPFVGKIGKYDDYSSSGGAEGGGGGGFLTSAVRSFFDFFSVFPFLEFFFSFLIRSLLLFFFLSSRVLIYAFSMCGIFISDLYMILLSFFILGILSPVVCFLFGPPGVCVLYLLSFFLSFILRVYMKKIEERVCLNLILIKRHILSFLFVHFSRGRWI